MKLNIFFRYVCLLMFFISASANAQINDDFNRWTARYVYGNYSQVTTAGTWSVTRGNVYPTGGNGMTVPGYVELQTQTSTYLAGTLITPTIAKGGAKSVTITAAVRPANINYVENTRVLLEKSINGQAWEAVGSFNIVTPKSLEIVTNVITVNDYSDNLIFRISRTFGKSIFIDRVVVDHSFVLSSDNDTVCKDNPVVLTAQSSAPFNYTWTSTTGGNLVQTTGASVTANPSQAATYTATGTYTTAFGTVTETKTISVGTKTSPTATLTGGGTIDTEPGSANLQVALTGTAPWSITYNINGSKPQTIIGITSSPYTFAVSPEINTNYTLTAVADATCNSGTTVGLASVLVNKTVWRNIDGVTAWSNGIPNASLNTYIYEPYNTAAQGSFVSKILTLDNNGFLTVSPNTVITAEQYVNNTIAENFVVESDANLMQSSELSNTGSIKVRRLANLAKMHYTFWSSPVANQNLYSFSDGGLVGGTPKNRFYVYNESNDYFVTTGLNNAYSFRAGQGYAIRGKDSYNADYNSPAPYTFTFTGTPNNGNLDYQYLKWTNADHGFNLVGNPYPSNLDFDALYDANSSLIYGTALFWTNQQFILGQQGSDYSGSNYAIYNRSGGVPATFQDGVSSPTPTQYIKVGQGFLVQSMAGSNNQPLQFNNSMRSYSPSSIFFNKGENQKSSKDRFWLNLKSPSKINNTILVSYIPGATDGYERAFDADLLVVGSDAFYSINGASKLAIQGRRYPLQQNDVVTLGAKYYETGDYSIILSKKEGLFNGDQVIYLKDKKLNKVINLTEEGSYKFAAIKGFDETRFEVIYEDLSSFETANKNAGTVNVVKDESELVVIDSRDNIKNVDVFDASGKLLMSLSGNNTKEIKLSTVGFVRGVYILKITSEKGITTKKVIL
ncbi:T9SS sorting signal type C domain-containing protein [Epilithonimonas hominis]|uniref:Por secretion system C-terminal sorting domain-containing protein n=1 Tax=Epilithonimonas hominis TaxID=420404 RepID=A0A1H6ILY4_9FLAO|nr:T9SS sorting signal type C domain-containing protein [Epilithonimonas hominis]SEH47997.1 Por secretion system C-terminal sorting domain-containing protein [Epilithonimonas hominis]